MFSEEIANGRRVWGFYRLGIVLYTRGEPGLAVKNRGGFDLDAFYGPSWIRGYTRKNCEYTKERTRWILLIGSTPSDAGARSLYRR